MDLSAALAVRRSKAMSQQELTSVELCGEANGRPHSGIVVTKRQLTEHHAELVLPTVLHLVLVLHIRVHITVEQLLVVLIGQANAHTLVGRPTSLGHLIVGLDDVHQDFLVQNLSFHF